METFNARNDIKLIIQKLQLRKEKPYDLNLVKYPTTLTFTEIM
jgi:hypothetical protein